MTEKEIRAAHRAWRRLKREIATLVRSSTPTRLRVWHPDDLPFRVSISYAEFRSIHA